MSICSLALLKVTTILMGCVVMVIQCSEASTFWRGYKTLQPLVAYLTSSAKLCQIDWRRGQTFRSGLILSPPELVHVVSVNRFWVNSGRVAAPVHVSCTLLSSICNFFLPMPSPFLITLFLLQMKTFSTLALVILAASISGIGAGGSRNERW